MAISIKSRRGELMGFDGAIRLSPIAPYEFALSPFRVVSYFNDNPAHDDDHDAHVRNGVLVCSRDDRVQNVFHVHHHN